MRYRYYICDVFTDVSFGGNQLAVLPEASGLSDRQMQQIAREFNFAETAFVFPPEAGQTRKVRIFTPTTEIPFAGHPNIGTAFTLAIAGEFGGFDQSTNVTFEEKAGVVPISIERREGESIWCELAAPEMLTLGETISPELVAAALSLEEGDIATATHPPQVASVGLPISMIELASLAALDRARVHWDGLEAIAAFNVDLLFHLYVRCADDFDLRVRMFAPMDGVPEDPATGSANCALAALLSHYNPEPNGAFRFRVQQGVAIGRPSVLEARTEKRDGAVVGAWIGGSCVSFAEGILQVD
jgi:trans-2,3-dihydro-3-hydroxyanthranilate isomerase